MFDPSNAIGNHTSKWGKIKFENSESVQAAIEKTHLKEPLNLVVIPAFEIRCDSASSDTITETTM